MILLNERQTELLKRIIEDYIKTARPVSSKSISEWMDCSSATIRNEMSYLEDLGLLEKTHTSSGRIPSQMGYRYYVDNIMEAKKITGEDMLKLQTIFHNHSLMLSDTILKSMEIISELTSCTSVVLGSSSSTNRVTKVEVVPLDTSHMIAMLITDKGHLEHIQVSTDAPYEMEDLKQTVDIINRLIIGTPIDEVSEKLEFEVKPVIGKYIKQHELIYNALYQAFQSVANKTEVKVTGASQILNQPEFNDADKIREIISKFDDKNMVSNIKEEASGINIYIGSETAFDDDVTIIKTKYAVGGEEGTIALVGPKRMEYDRVVSLLEYIKKNMKES